jgi:hypothetical protein
MQPPSIGTARMTESRAVVLTLRATGPGLTGDAEVTYRPGDQHYAMVVAHVGGLEPGESKPVPPFSR